MSKNPCRRCSCSAKKQGRSMPREFTEPCASCEKLRQHKEWLANQRKYVDGELITSLDELVRQENVVMFLHKPKPVAVIQSMQLRTVKWMLDSGRIRKAEPNGRAKPQKGALE